MSGRWSACDGPSPASPARILTAILLGLLAGSSCTPAVARPTGPGSEPAELVVLVHGMGRSSLSMEPLSWALERAGYRVMNWGYSSTCCSIAELGGRLRSDLRDRPEWGTARVHFVGHSLGNIIIRWVLAHEDTSAAFGRVVMLAPPNRGSHTADRLAPALGWLLTPLPELRSAAMRSDSALVIPEAIEVGVIAGRDDGKVSIAETLIDGMDGHVVVPATHSFLMFRPDVKRLILEFLRSGAFERSVDEPSHFSIRAQ